MVTIQTKNKYLHWTFWMLILLLIFNLISSVYQLVFSLSFFFPTGIVEFAGGGGTWLFENILFGSVNVFLQIALFIVLLFIVNYLRTKNQKFLRIAKNIVLISILLSILSHLFSIITDVSNTLNFGGSLWIPEASFIQNVFGIFILIDPFIQQLFIYLIEFFVILYLQKNKI